MNNSQLVSKIFPTEMESGKSFSCQVIMKNIGTTSWFGGRHKLGSQSPQDNMDYGKGRIELGNNSVNPGGTAAFNFTLIAPTSIGNRSCDWKMLEEGVEWFGSISTHTLKVTPAPSPQLELPNSINYPIGGMILNSGPYVADGSTKLFTWENKRDRTYKIIRSYLWMGAAYGIVADIHTHISRVSDNNLIQVLQYDRYADPSLPKHGESWAYDLYPVIIKPNEKIQMLCYAQPLVPNMKGNPNLVHHAASIWVIE